jgi:hypothetical protein
MKAFYRAGLGVKIVDSIKVPSIFRGLPPPRPSSHQNNRTKSDNPLSKVKEDILTVTKTMQNNMNKVLDRGSKLEDLQDKTGTA